ncbi:pentatricopeptide repeat-containing protein [Tanacetum coccineum]
MVVRSCMDPKESRISAGKEVDIGLGGGRDKPLHPADMFLYSWDERADVCFGELTERQWRVVIWLRDLGMIERTGMLLSIILSVTVLHPSPFCLFEHVMDLMLKKRVTPDPETCGYVFSAYVDRGFYNTAMEALQVMSIHMLSEEDISEKNTFFDEECIYSEDSEAESRILNLFKDSNENLAVALLNLRCVIKFGRMRYNVCAYTLADACFWQANLVASNRKRHVDKRGSRAVQVGSQAVHDGLWMRFENGTGHVTCIAPVKVEVDYELLAPYENVGANMVEDGSAVGGENTRTNDISPNSLSFHPVHHTFASAGSDGAFNFWDKDSKQH